MAVAVPIDAFLGIAIAFTGVASGTQQAPLAKSPATEVALEEATS